MKVRITRAPQKMVYGGQKKHSLDIVRTTIDDYDPDYNDVERKNTRSADPREDSNVEVEGGEEIKYTTGPLQKAVGPNHNPDPNKEGGVPMNLPDNSFVYSKRKGKMGVKGSVLSQFGKSEKDKKTYSFAELAGQYRPNKYYDILQNDKADPLQKATAAAMIQKYDDKLASLAILQESKKGFPQGIPEIAKEKFAKMQQYMQQSQQQQMEQQPQDQMMQQPPMMGQQPMAMYGYNTMNYGGFVPDYSSIGDMYRYQAGGSSRSQDKKIAQYISVYAQLTKKSEEEIYQALQSLGRAQQQEALQNIMQTVEDVISQQQGGGGGDQQMMQQQDTSGYYSAPGGEPDYAMQQAQEEQPTEEEETQQMRRGGSYSGTYYQGTYFANGGSFVPTYGDSSYNDQFGGEIYDYDNYMLPKAQGGLQSPNKVSKKDFEAKVASGEYQRIQGTNKARKGNTVIEVAGTYKPGTPGYTKKGSPGKSVEVRGAVSGGKPGKAWEDWIKAQLAKGVTIEELAKKGHGTVSGLQKYKSYYKPIQQATPDEVVPETKGTCLDEKGNPDPTLEYNEKTGKCERKKEIQEYITYEEGEEGPKAGDVTGGNFGGGYYGIPFQNTLGIMAAAAYPPLYLRPFYDEPQGVIPRPTFYDPERELASAQETARGLEQMAGMINPQAAGAMANYIQANAAKTSADTIGRYQNLNVGVANQYSPLQAQVYNSLAAQKRETRNKRYTGETVAAQQYQNAMRKYGTDFAETLGEGIEAGIKKGQLYDTSKYYTADPFGRLRLKPGVNAADAIMGSTASGSNMSSEFLKDYDKYKGTMDKDALNQYLKIKYGPSSRRGSSSDDDVAFNFGASAYPFMS